MNPSHLGYGSPLQIITQKKQLANYSAGLYNEVMLSTDKKWLEYCLPVMDKIREDLAATDAVVLAARSGATHRKRGEKQAELTLNYFDETYVVGYPRFEAHDARTGEECSPGLLFLFLLYFHTADGTRPADRWISYRELPDGMFYNQAFQGYSGDRLVQTFGNELTRFKKAAIGSGGEELSLGDAAFMFRALPRLLLGVVYWLGDEEFEPYANVLFDAAASHYLSTDGLAVLGRELCDRIIRQG
jgi:hypothetical protein